MRWEQKSAVVELEAWKHTVKEAKTLKHPYNLSPANPGTRAVDEECHRKRLIEAPNTNAGMLEVPRSS